MSKLSELDILRLSDAKVNDKGETIYYARGEAECDVAAFSWLTRHQFTIDLWCPNEIPYGVVIRFATKLSYSEIMGYLSLIPDGHILMRTLDVFPVISRFYNVVIHDSDNTRATLPRNHKKLKSAVESYLGDDGFSRYAETVSSGFIRVMNGKQIRAAVGKNLHQKYESIIPLENIEPIPEYPENVSGLGIKRSRKTKENIRYKLRIHITTEAKTAIRKLDKLIHKWNVIEDRDIHVKPWFYDGYENRGDKNFYDGIDILEFEENEDPDKLAWEIHDAIPGLDGYKSFEYFNALDDDNWETAYTQWLYGRSCDD